MTTQHFNLHCAQKKKVLCSDEMDDEMHNIMQYYESENCDLQKKKQRNHYCGLTCKEFQYQQRMSSCKEETDNTQVKLCIADQIHLKNSFSSQ